MMWLWRHLTCFSLARKFKDVEYQDIEGYNDLDKKDQDHVEEYFLQSKEGKKSKKGKEEFKADESVYDDKKYKGYTEDEYRIFCDHKESL